MRHFILYRLIVLFIISLFFYNTLTQTTFSQKISKDPPQQSGIIDGQILFAPINYRMTYLIDNTGTVTHTWDSNYLPGESIRWLGDNQILRSIKTEVHGYGGVGGGVQIVNWDGTIEWDYRCDTNGDLSHHDIYPMPNGNVLMIAWETKTREQTINAGRNPSSFIGDTFLPDHIIEVKPTGPSSGDIVWEWHVWDHLIQDYDSTKANYGVIEQHPELIDINYGNNPVLDDWMHTNSIDYNEKFDQILISVHNFDEIWIIDHSTTTQEAMGHSGGNSGKGGDILYRWGNPITYHAGPASDKKLFSQHDASWIDDDCPGAGNILIFNNGDNRPAGVFSSIDEIIPPVNENGEYIRTPGSAYGPTTLTWCYTANPPESFYSGVFSGAQRLPDGNTLICDGVDGRFFEVTPDGSTIWQYINPYPGPNLNAVFKIIYIPPEQPPEPHIPDLDCTSSLSWADVTPGSTVTGVISLKNKGDNQSLLNWTINTSLLSWGNWSFNPASGTRLMPEDGVVTIQVTVTAPKMINSNFEGYIRLENTDNPLDFDVVPVYLTTPNHSAFEGKSYFIRILIEYISQFYLLLQRLLF
jgi:Arylsulfotransferase (ASST)